MKNSKSNKSIIFATCLIFALFLSLASQMEPAQATVGWLDTYGNRVQITVAQNPSGTTGMTVTVKVLYASGTNTLDNTGINPTALVYVNGQSLQTFTDVAFTDSSGSTTLVFHMLEVTTGTSALFEVKLPNDLSLGTTIIYCYYGLPSHTTSDSSISAYVNGSDFKDGTTTGMTTDTEGSATITVPSGTSGSIYGFKPTGWTVTDVLTHGAPGTWDQDIVNGLTIAMDEHGNVYENATGYQYGYYFGQVTNGVSKEGLAVSNDDGATWTKYANNPLPTLLGNPSYAWMSYLCYESVVVHLDNGTWVMLATGQDKSIQNGGIGKLGFFSSPDGITWTPYAGNPILSPTNTFWYSSGVTSTRITKPNLCILSDGRYLLCFESIRTDSTANAWKHFAALSTDLIHWTPVNSGNPIQTAGTGWDNVGVADPKVMEISTGKYLMIYNGISSSAQWSVGFAYTEDSTFATWTKYSGNPIITPTAPYSTHAIASWFPKQSVGTSQGLIYIEGYLTYGTSDIFRCVNTQTSTNLLAISTTANDAWSFGYNTPTLNTRVETKVTSTGDASDASTILALALTDQTGITPVGADTALDPTARIEIVRRSPTSADANIFFVRYWSAGHTANYWHSDTQTWTTTYDAGAKYGGSGTYIVSMWENSTYYGFDLMSTDRVSDLGNCVLAKASVETITGTPLWSSAEWFNNYYYSSQQYNYFVIQKCYGVPLLFSSIGTVETTAPYYLTINPSSVGVTDPVAGTYYSYSPGATVTVTATPSITGWVFSYWLINGTSTSTSNPYSFTFTGSTTLTPIFTTVSFIVGANSTTLYFRNEQATVNNQTGYSLSTTNTATEATLTVSTAGNHDVNFGFRVWIVHYKGITTTELTAGSPVAILTRSTDGNGFQTATWLPSSHALIMGYDAIKVVCYSSFDGSTWTKVTDFISNNVASDNIAYQTWNFTMWTSRTYTTTTVGALKFGSTTFDSAITNVGLAIPSESDTHLLSAYSGNWVQFILGTYTTPPIMGSAFYLLIIAMFGGSLYFRNKSTSPILISFMLLGGAGGLIWFFVPLWAALVVVVICGIIGAFIVWRMIR